MTLVRRHWPQSQLDSDAALYPKQFGTRFGHPLWGRAIAPRARLGSSDRGQKGVQGRQFRGRILTPNRGLKMKPENGLTHEFLYGDQNAVSF